MDLDILNFFRDVDEIWHAGDIGNIDVVYQLQAAKTLRAVYGNIDGAEVRATFKEFEIFKSETLNVLLIHIGGYPGKYEKIVKDLFKTNKIDLFVCGHSHILKVMYDKHLGIMHMNPGAAGMSGFHSIRTALRFNIDNQDIKNLQILEISR
jgi:putative phosphoesterase